MKRAAIILLLCILMTAGSFAASVDEIAENMTFDWDMFRGVGFIRYRYQPTGQTHFLPYIGYDEDGNKWMFARAFLARSNWLFMDRVYVVVGETRYQTARYESWSDLVKQHVTTRGTVQEEIHFRWSDHEVETLGRAIAEAPLNQDIWVRFSGSNGVVDFRLSSAHKLVWEDMVFLFDHFDPNDAARLAKISEQAEANRQWQRSQEEEKSQQLMPLDSYVYNHVEIDLGSDTRLEFQFDENGAPIPHMVEVTVRNRGHREVELSLYFHAPIGLVLADEETTVQQVTLDPLGSASVSWQVLVTTVQTSDGPRYYEGNFPYTISLFVEGEEIRTRTWFLDTRPPR